jgi:cell division protein ZapA
MSNATIPVTVKIMGKEYRIACPEDEKGALLASADRLNRRMREMRDSGRVIGADRVAVMAGLNLTHELLTQGTANKTFSEEVERKVRALGDRVENALEADREMEL